MPRATIRGFLPDSLLDIPFSLGYNKEKNMEEISMLEIKIQGRAEDVVREENTARSLGSGDLPVFATPCMVALMENASLRSVALHLEEGQSTVGTRICVSHDSATPVGMKVWAESTLTEIDGRRLVFEVRAFDERGLIGQGTHERFIIKQQSFLERAEAKKA